MNIRSLLLLLGVLFGCASHPPLHAQEPLAVFLTWSADPTTTVTVDWHLPGGAEVSGIQVRGPGLSGWRTFAAEDRIEFPYSDRIVRRSVVRGLTPDALYEMRFHAGGTIYRYRSMPADLSRPVRFATGGDTQFSEESFGRTNRVASAYDLDFVLFGGDLSYANGDPRRVERKEQWFETVTRTLAAEGNRLIPVVVAIGNHEVWESRRLDEGEDAAAFMSRWGVSERQATYFRPLFAFPRGGYHDALDFGNYLSIIALDSDHMTEVVGAQTDWLRETLRARSARPHVFPVYHQPAYPSVRRFEGATSARIREHWVPLFEESGVRLVFENHDHIYKRTIPLRAGRFDPSGVVFLGDGAWGVTTREIGRDQGGEAAWYLDRAISDNHAIIVTLEGRHQHVLVVNGEGAVIDEYPSRPSPMNATGNR
jgi:acid phosphatase type 7